MPIKNILVGLAIGGEEDPGRDFAFSIASTLKAHVEGRLYALEPEIAIEAFGTVAADILQTHRAAVAKQANTTSKKFEEAARKAKVSSSHTVVRATPGLAATAFGQRGRVNDISIVAQSAKGLEHVGDLFAEAALFYSGRPLIVVPRRAALRFSLDRVLVAWDGSLHASRAVTASMPLLTAAKRVEVLVVGNKDQVKETQAHDLIKNLERHDLDAELVFRHDSDAAKAIATEAKSWSASLLVMGGYGHSRLTEWAFGGVTRAMVTSPPLPVLMAH